MPTFVALLRGINNIGKSKRVSMAELRALVCGLGYTDVVTLLNSGNVVFRAARGTPAKHAANIAAAVFTHFKVDVPVIVHSASELAAIVSENPIKAKADEHSRFLVAFVRNSTARSSLRTIEPLVVPPEQFAIGKSAAYMLCAAGIPESKAGRALIGKPGRLTTTRNLATVLKLRALAMNATPNRSIERTSSGKLRLPAAAAHVKLQGLPHSSIEFMH
jgi:uncharacterized protein (DUF1697 family)